MDLIKGAAVSHDTIQNHWWDTLNIVGLGATGSHLAMLLGRSRLWRKIVVWDPDRVESHNPLNQVYNSVDVGISKAKALAGYLSDLSGLEIAGRVETVKPELLMGSVVLCVDRMGARREVLEGVNGKLQVPWVMDTRVGTASDGVQRGLLLVYRPWQPQEVAAYKRSLFEDGPEISGGCTAEIDATFAGLSAGIVAMNARSLHQNRQSPAEIRWRERPLAIETSFSTDRERL